MKIRFSWRRTAESLAWRLLSHAGMVHHLHTGLEVPVETKSDHNVADEIFHRREYDPFLDLLPAPRRVLDLGCNCGFFPLLLEHRARIAGGPRPGGLLVDAGRESVAKARRVLARNGLGERFEVREGLVGPRGAATPFYESRFAESSSLWRPKHSGKARLLPSLDLDALPGPFDLVKCDIEGGEEFLLRDWASFLSRVPALLVEWHDRETPWPEARRRLEASGLRCLREERTGVGFHLALLRRE